MEQKPTRSTHIRKLMDKFAKATHTKCPSRQISRSWLCGAAQGSPAEVVGRMEGAATVVRLPA